MRVRIPADWCVFAAKNVLRALPARLACARSRSPVAGSVDELHKNYFNPISDFKHHGTYLTNKRFFIGQL